MSWHGHKKQRNAKNALIFVLNPRTTFFFVPTRSNGTNVNVKNNCPYLTKR